MPAYETVSIVLYATLGSRTTGPTPCHWGGGRKGEGWVEGMERGGSPPLKLVKLSGGAWMLAPDGRLIGFVSYGSMLSVLICLILSVPDTPNITKVVRLE